MAFGLTLCAWADLFYIDLVALRGFRGVENVVKRTPVRPRPSNPEIVAMVVDAMTRACALYVKPAQCLQRSAVVTRLLRRHGVEADLVIGCHIPPLKAHAWVEVSGKIVSDDMVGLEHFRILDRW